MDTPSYAILIPARYASTRLPGKVLLRESGRYLVQHVHERALDAPGVSRAVVLTDDDRVEAAVRSYGGEVMRTSPDHASGTDRCAEAAARLQEAVVVNLQADEPGVDPRDLADLARAAAADVDLATLAHAFTDPRGLRDPHAVKAIVRADGIAVDFRREAPSGPDPADGEPLVVLHHVGIYAFPRRRLLDFAALPPSPREGRERLEQLRAVEAGWVVRVLRARAPAGGIDTRADYDAFLASLDG